LGQFPHWLYEQSELQMRSGDNLLLFTDGLVESCNAEEESFGEHNLIRIARENPSSSAEHLMGLLTRAASQHSGEHFQDDASLIVLKAT
jgi:serine phosphatase RsbU (regulator of sigma subunit)